MSTKLRNKLRQELVIHDFSTVSIGSFKSKVKDSILKSQKGHDKDMWCDLAYK